MRIFWTHQRPIRCWNLKCVTQWVRIHVDMSGTHSARIIIIGTLIHIMIPTRIMKIFTVRTFRITIIHLSHCFLILYIARGETPSYPACTFLLIPHCWYYLWSSPWSSVQPDYNEHYNQARLWGCSKCTASEGPHFSWAPNFVGLVYIMH